MTRAGRPDMQRAPATVGVRKSSGLAGVRWPPVARRWPLLLTLVGALAWSPAANAAECRPPWSTGPVVDDAAGVMLHSLDSQLHCSGSRRAWSCRLRETYVVSGGSSAGTPAAVYFDPRVSAEVRIDGTDPIGIDPPTFDGAVAEMLELSDANEGSVIGLMLPTGPGVTRRIVVELRIDLDRECRAPPPLERRHPLVSRNSAISLDWDAWGSLGAERAPEYTERRGARFPPHWQLTRRGGLRRDRDGPRGDWIGPVSTPYRVQRRPAVAWGGPFVAVGVARRTGGAEPKLRAGWEIGVLRRVLVNLAAESDARRHLEVVPALELTMGLRLPRSMWYLPLPSVGIGAPVQVMPHTRGGVRGLLGFHWPYVALVGFIDGYPPVGSHRRIVTGGAMLQLGI